MTLDVNELLRQAHEQQAAQEALKAALNATLQQPAQIRQINVSLTAVRPEGDHKVLMIALPIGERIDVRLPPQVCKAIGGQLLAELDDAQADPDAEQEPEARADGT